MKKFAKILSLALVLALVLSLCACGGKDDTKTTEAPVKEVTIVGVWGYDMDFGKMMEGAAGEVDEDAAEYLDMMLKIYEGVNIKMIIDLKEDGTFVMTTDEDSVKVASDTINGNIQKYFPEMAELMDPSEMTEDMGEDSTGTYRYEDGKLYFTQEGEEENPANYWVVELSESELKITDIVGEDAEDGSYASLLPLVFTRQ